MVIAIPYHGGDIRLAAKNVRWMGFLSEKYGDYLKEHTVLLVPSIQASRRRLHHQIVELSSIIFGKSFTCTPENEDERGWPWSCNTMFRHALEAVETHLHDDMLLLEPDAFATRMEWMEMIVEEYATCGKTFMGAYVAGSPHMTGIAVYGYGWRTLAPSLVTADKAPWDLHSAPEVVPHCHFTSLIQHINRREHLARIENLDPRSVIFHQNKTGSLAHDLDHAHFGGEWSRHPVFQDTEEEQIMAVKFYHAENSNRSIKSGNKKFAFTPYGMFGGTWRGLYATEKEDEQIALAQLVANPKNAVKEITQEEWEAKSKKKAVTQPYSALGSWNEHSAQAQRPSTHLAGKGGAVVVENPSPLPDESGNAPAPVVQKIEDVIRTTTIKPVDIPETPKTRPGRKKAA